MLHPDTELRRRDARIGYGVYARALIPKGTIIWVLDPLDQVLTPERVAAFGPELQDTLIRYSYLDGDGNRILCWDLTRYMNHSCACNVLSPGLPLEIAVRDILPGEELTNDYSSLNIEHDFDCACGAGTCRGVIRRDDFERLAPGWDERLRLAAACTPGVRQPLAAWLRRRHGLLDRTRFPDPLPSILAHRWRGEGVEASLAGPASLAP